MYAIEDFLKQIQPYCEGEDLGTFFAELMKVPNYQERFERILKADPSWLEAALKTRDENGFHVFGLLDEKKVEPFEEIAQNELELRNFDMGTAPTVKVKTYKRSLVIKRPIGK